MTHERDIDRLLDLWLLDGPTQVADRVILDAADRIDRQAQRPSWRFPRRPTPMISSMRWIAAAAAVMLIAVVGFAVLGRPSDSGVGGPVATPSSSPSPRVAPSAAPTQAWGNPQQCGNSLCGGPLTAGRYSSTSLEPAVTYTLRTPWVNNGDWDAFFMLYPDTPANRALWDGGTYTGPYILVVPRPTISPSACGGAPTSDAVEVQAAEFADYLGSREGITTTAPTAVTVSDLTGLQVDVAFDPAWTGCYSDMPSDAFSGRPDGIRYIVLDEPNGGSLMISLVAPATFDAFVAEAMPVVESFQFDLSRSPSPSP